MHKINIWNTIKQNQINKGVGKRHKTLKKKETFNQILWCVYGTLPPWMLWDNINPFEQKKNSLENNKVQGARW